jgi:type I restriction-modification system DNA methylase subunit
MNHQALSSFIWSVADLLRVDYKQSGYGRVILTFTVLRRLDCVLEATMPAVLAEFAAKTKAGRDSDSGEAGKLLAERRSALIAAAVIGQIDVRNA